MSKFKIGDSVVVIGDRDMRGYIIKVWKNYRFPFGKGIGYELDISCGWVYPESSLILNNQVEVKRNG